MHPGGARVHISLILIEIIEKVLNYRKYLEFTLL